MSDRYNLNEQGEPVLEPDLLTWANRFEKEDRKVANEDIGDVNVSTVFLGLDHSYGEGCPPILYETMIFGGEHDQYQERCSTREEALGMHKIACELVKGENNAST